MAWERCWYRSNKVWILVDEAGQAELDDRGHAQLRYKPDDDRTYTVRPAEIRPLEAGAAPPPPPPPTRPPIEAWVHVEPNPEQGWVAVGVLLAWRDRKREVAKRLPAASDDEIAVAAALVALGVVRKPAWPVRVHAAAADRLQAIHDGAGTDPPECGESLRQGTASFEDLSFLALPTPTPTDAEHAARIAHAARDP